MRGTKTILLVGLAAAAGALALSAIRLALGQDAWAMPAFTINAGLLAYLAHSVLRGGDQLTRYKLRHRPLAGPKPGARLGD